MIRKADVKLKPGEDVVWIRVWVNGQYNTIYLHGFDGIRWIVSQDTSWKGAPQKYGPRPDDVDRNSRA